MESWVEPEKKNKKERKKKKNPTIILYQEWLRNRALLFITRDVEQTWLTVEFTRNSLQEKKN